MRKRSITTKITIWYTIFLLLITGGFLAILVYAGNLQASALAQARLKGSVADASEEIEQVGEGFIVDDDLEFYNNGVYISVYDEAGELLEGRRPGELPELPELEDQAVTREQDEKGQTWYVYDSRFQVDGKSIWVRGIVKDLAGEGAFVFMLRLAAIAFPILILIATLGGYGIARRAFRPVRRIIETVEDIGRDGSLFRRIYLEGEEAEAGRKTVMQKGPGGSAGQGDEITPAVAPKDEIYRLAHTFNGMFDKLERSFEEEKQFTSDVSHELRTPLAVIISQSDYALEDEDYREKALRTIGREARRMNGLVNRLLTLARSDAGRLKISRDPVDLSQLCRTIAQQQGPLAGSRNMEIVTSIEPDVTVTGDEEMLIRVILNLMDNAVKYGSPPKRFKTAAGGEASAPGGAASGDAASGDPIPGSLPPGRITLTLEKDGEQALCTVEDDGPGIPQEQLLRIWERFYRGDASRSEEGSGLGLSMVKALVRAHGGQVEAESGPDGGCRFTVKLPLAGKKAGE